MDQLRKLFILLLILVALAGCSERQLRVERVVDGDTFELSNGETVRLIGIDTPEVHNSDHLREQARRSNSDIATIKQLGREASQHAKQLAQGEAVELTYDQANAANNHRGGYDRLLAYVWVLNDSGERAYMVNRRMVADGYAYAYTKYPFRYMGEFRRLARKARGQERGLWETMKPIIDQMMQ